MSRTSDAIGGMGRCASRGRVMGRRGRRLSQGEEYASTWRSTGEVGETQTEVWAEVGKPPCMVVGLDVNPNVAIRVRPPGSAGALAGRVSQEAVD